MSSWARRVGREGREQWRRVVLLGRWAVLGSLSGVLAGLASFAFLEALDLVTEVRLDAPWLLWLLPVAGLVIGLVIHLFGGEAGRGNALLLEQLHQPTAWLPRRMAPLVFAGTVTAHLFGASVGREGAAVQMSGSLTDGMARVLRLSPADRRMLLVAAIAGGFGSVFGVPLAGAVFGIEVQSRGRVRYEALVPALAASFVGHLVVQGLGHAHPLRPQLDLGLDAALLGWVALAGVVFGLASYAFIEAVHVVRGLVSSRVAWPPARLVLGGVATIALALLFGRDFLGLSLPLIDQALAGPAGVAWVPVLKAVFTVVALGCGFPGGEVTPLFVIGATAGAALGGVLGADPVVLAAVGFVAVFGAATNTPVACAVMGVELFGTGAVGPLAVGCAVAYLCSGPATIYERTRPGGPGAPGAPGPTSTATPPLG